MGVWYYSQLNIGKGFKVVPILDEGGQARWPSDAAAVCSGRYPLRIEARYLVHPEANQATKEFARWLLTPEAGKAIAEAPRKAGGWPNPTMPAFFHVTQRQSADKAPGEAAVVVMTPPAVKFDAKVEGAVAVLPTQRLSIFNLMIHQAHQAAYEQLVSEAIAADGRLKLVDRSLLAKVLEERSATGKLPASGAYADGGRQRFRLFLDRERRRAGMAPGASGPRSHGVAAGRTETSDRRGRSVSLQTSLE